MKLEKQPRQLGTWGNLARIIFLGIIFELFGLIAVAIVAVIVFGGEYLCTEYYKQNRKD